MDLGEKIFAGFMLTLIVGMAIVIGLGIKNDAFSDGYSAPPAVAEKPQTKTRCDLTGFMASSIIAEEAANGYRFNGRVSTFLCGENGLSFSLEQQ